MAIRTNSLPYCPFSSSSGGRGTSTGRSLETLVTAEIVHFSVKWIFLAPCKNRIQIEIIYILLKYMYNLILI